MISSHSSSLTSYDISYDIIAENKNSRITSTYHSSFQQHIISSSESYFPHLIGILSLLVILATIVTFRMKRHSSKSKCPRKSKEPRLLEEIHEPLVFERNMDSSIRDSLSSREDMEVARSEDAYFSVEMNNTIENLVEEEEEAYDLASQLQLNNLPVLVLARITSSLAYSDLQNFRLVNRRFCYAERAERNARTTFSIKLVKQLFPNYVHYPGNTMFSMGRALIATLRYFSQSNMNIKEIDLNGIRCFSSTHFNDVVKKSHVPIDKLFRKVEVINSSRCFLSFSDLEWFAKYAPNVTHIKVVEEPLLISCEDSEVSNAEMKEAMYQLVKQKEVSVNWSFYRRNIIFELSKIFGRLQCIEFY